MLKKEVDSNLDIKKKSVIIIKLIVVPNQLLQKLLSITEHIHKSITPYVIIAPKIITIETIQIKFLFIFSNLFLFIRLTYSILKNDIQTQRKISD